MSPIPHNRPWITSGDHAAVDAVLESGWVAQGQAVAGLEAAFVGLHGGGGACAVSSGTAALGLALRALGVGQGMAVGVPTYACSALLNAVYWVGARPLVLDVTPDAFVVDPGLLLGQCDALIAVHTYGAPAPIRAYRETCPKIVEDCCHSLGGRLADQPLGQQGDAAIYSFHATKPITGGQGGLIWSRQDGLVGKAIDYRQFDCREEYEPRFNFQLSDLNAGLALSQFSRLEDMRRRRSGIARRYAEALPKVFSCQAGVLDEGRMVYRFVPVAPDRATRDALLAHLKSREIGCIVPLERYELLHRYLKLDPLAYPVAERLVDTTLSLPIYPALSDSEVDRVCAALDQFRP